MQIFHAPSNFNASSMIDRSTLASEDPYEIIPKLIKKAKKAMEDGELDQIVHLGDRRGSLLCRLKGELL